MSQENLDLVRSIYAAWERGDFGSAEWAHHEIEFVVTKISQRAAGRGPRHGGGLARLAEAWEGLRVEADEYRELDGERVLVFGHLSGRGKTSGMSSPGARG